MEGVVTKLVLSRGFGFIAPSHGGRDIFFHMHDCLNLPWNDQLLQRPVVFEVVHREQGEHAKNVRPM